MSLSSFCVLFECISIALTCIVSAFYSTRLFGHYFSCTGCRPLSLFGLHYHNTSDSDISITVSALNFAFHIPRPSNPRWGTFTLFEYEQKDSACHLSLAKVEVTLWFFPRLFRFSAGPWFAVQLDDFKLRIRSSTNTPHWVERLRNNLVDAILTGEILRVDDFRTSIAMSSLTGTRVRDDQDSSAAVQKPGVTMPEFEDEVRVSAEVEGYDVINWQQRIYSFGKMRIQLRKSWVDGRGSYTMIAEDTRWTKVQSPCDRQSIRLSFLWYVFDL